MLLLIYQGAFAHPRFAQAASGTRLHRGRWRSWFSTDLSPMWGLIWLPQLLGASPPSREPEGSRESRARLPAFPLCKYLWELLPRHLLRSPAASGSSSAPLGCASLAIPNGFTSGTEFFA